VNLKKFKQIFGEFAEDAEFINENIKKLNLVKDDEILDIGTGMGVMSCLLALNGFEILTGEPKLDPEINNHDDEHHHHDDYHEHHHENHDWNAWGNWKESAKLLGVLNKIKFQYFDAQDLPFEDKSFKSIFLYDSLQHIQNRELAIKECIRVLKPEGMIVIIEWTKKKIEEDYKKYGYRIDFINPGEFINQNDISVELNPGKHVNIYILRQN
jgi:2-polyprenyl-3-methyl-5-hydroxy-6-metoxy-1,4-benzoquinol methylase